MVFARFPDAIATGVAELLLLLCPYIVSPIGAPTTGDRFTVSKLTLSPGLGVFMSETEKRTLGLDAHIM